MRLPSTNPVSLPYGYTGSPYSTASPHAGTDYAGGDLNSYAPEQVRITAFYPQDATPTNPCGNQLDMISMDGQRTYRFCHSSEVYAQVGQTYAEGTVLAKEGAVGYAFGVHLHCVMWVNGSRVDPDATLKSLIGENMPTPIDPELVWEHYVNYTGVDVGKGSPATQGRVNDHGDNDFWFGLVPMMNGIRLNLVQQVADLTKANADLQAQINVGGGTYTSAPPLFVKKG